MHIQDPLGSVQCCVTGGLAPVHLWNAFTGVKFCIPGFHLARGITAKNCIYYYVAIYKLYYTFGDVVEQPLFRCLY